MTARFALEGEPLHRPRCCPSLFVATTPAPASVKCLATAVFEHLKKIKVATVAIFRIPAMSRTMTGGVGLPLRLPCVFAATVPKQAIKWGVELAKGVLKYLPIIKKIKVDVEVGKNTGLKLEVSTPHSVRGSCAEL